MKPNSPPGVDLTDHGLPKRHNPAARRRGETPIHGAGSHERQDVAWWVSRLRDDGAGRRTVSRGSARHPSTTTRNKPLVRGAYIVHAPRTNRHLDRGGRNDRASWSLRHRSTPEPPARMMGVATAGEPRAAHHGDARRRPGPNKPAGDSRRQRPRTTSDRGNTHRGFDQGLDRRAHGLGRADFHKAWRSLRGAFEDWLTTAHNSAPGNASGRTNPSDGPPIFSLGKPPDGASRSLAEPSGTVTA